MIFENRKFGVVKVSSKQELQTRLSSGLWPLCTAFQLGDLVFANSSQPGHVRQEFSVLYDDQLIEVLPVSTMTPQELHTALEWLIAGGETFMGIVEPMLEPADRHRCALC